MVQTDRGEKVLVHKDRVIVTKPPKGPIVKDAFGVEVSKAEKPPMAPDKLRRKKKISADLTIASSTLGIAGLGALAGGKLLPIAAKSKKLTSLIKKPWSPAKAHKVGSKMMNTGMGLSTGATGVGGIGGYNYASIQRAEARKKRI
jgi:hypothetical protein